MNAAVHGVDLRQKHSTVILAGKTSDKFRVVQLKQNIVLRRRQYSNASSLSCPTVERSLDLTNDGFEKPRSTDAVVTCEN